MVCCKIDGCENAVKVRGMCSKHYQQYFNSDSFVPSERFGRKCSIKGCSDKHKANGFCNKHNNKKWYDENHDKQTKKQKIYGRTLKGLFVHLLQECKRKGVDCNLSFEEFCELRGKFCHYCKVGKLSGASHSLDRKDSNLGYSLENCVPCCWPCNDTKGHRMSYDEMINLMAFRAKANGE
jgi:hypothetical protein